MSKQPQNTGSQKGPGGQKEPFYSMSDWFQTNPPLLTLLSSFMHKSLHLKNIFFSLQSISRVEAERNRSGCVGDCSKKGSDKMPQSCIHTGFHDCFYWLMKLRSATSRAYLLYHWCSSAGLKANTHTAGWRLPLRRAGRADV